MNPTTAHRLLAPSGADALEGRFGLRVSARLSESGVSLPHDVTERLRIAREMALSRAKVQKAAASVAAVGSAAVVHPDGSLSLGGGGSEGWWPRLSMVLPLLVLIIGFVVMQEWEFSEQISATADIDAALLSDTLPPEAYADPGFDEYLRGPDDLVAAH